MPVLETNGVLRFVRLELVASEIPDLLRRHAKNYRGAQDLEALGANLVRADFPDHEVGLYVQAVCRWGRGHRLVNRVVQKNTGQQMASALRESLRLAQKGQVAEGVDVICQLRYLGQSFASKQLRFLAPTMAVILDDVIRTALGYSDTVEGYREFLADCRQILDNARVASIKTETGAPLRIADVEAAIFAKIQKY
jgi:hypothetical protein